MSPRHQEGLAHLFYGIKRGGGFVALTGEVGTGKTTLCRHLLGHLPEDIEIAYILNPKLNAIELLATICDELGISYADEKQSLKYLNDQLNRYLLDAYAKGKRSVLMIDEAQNLSLEVLEQVRLLTNLETAKSKLLQIILVGQPELQLLLKRNELRQLNQRVTARYHLQALSFQETRAYIAHRLTCCGARSGLFKTAAMRKIYKLSNGIPRLINILCDRCLLGAYATEANTVTSAIVRRAAKEVLPKREKGFYGARWALIGAILLLIGLSASYFNNGQNFRLASITAQSTLSVNDAEKAGERLIKQGIVLEQFKKTEEFSKFIAAAEHPLQTALTKYLEAWKVKPEHNETLTCKTILKRGYRCLFDRTDWKTLLALQRQVILEFSLADTQKRYALLTGTRHGEPVLLFNKQHTFALQDILPFWQGYFLLLWKPPLADTMTIFLHQKSPDVFWVRQKLDQIDNNAIHVEDPFYFDNNLEMRIKRFQRQSQLYADGVVGPRTMIKLQNAAAPENAPLLDITE